MTSFQILLILGAALGFVTLDLLRKILADHLKLVPLLFWLTAGVIPIYLVWAVSTGLSAPQVDYWPPAIASIVLNVAANLLYLRAVHVGELSRTIPLLSLTPVLTTVFAIPLLGEVPTALQLSGIGLVVIGALLLQIGAAPSGHTDASAGRSELPLLPRSYRLPQSAWLMLGVACLWSATTPLDKLALESGEVALHALVLHVGIAAAMLVWLLLRKETGGLRFGRQTGWLLLAAIAASAIALACQLLALELVYAALLETLKRGMGGIAALALGYFVFRERVTLAKAIAIAIMVVGVSLLLR